MEYKQLNLSVPENFYREIKRWIPRGKITDFMLESARVSLQQLRFKKASEDAFGSWAKHRHDELAAGTADYIRKLRRGRKY
ncbi:MAG: hypothetical protein AABZ44_00815 [Elusimicrobiota bacterium]